MKAIHLFLFALFSLLSFSAQAQYRFHYARIGISAGAANYQGDLGSSINVLSTRVGAGIDLQYRLNPFLGARLGVLYARVGAADSLSTNAARLRRNLSFRSPVSEANLMLVINLVPSAKRFQYRPKLVPYLFGGISVFRFNPQARLGDQWIDLQPLGTEGQQIGSVEYPAPYERHSIAIPMGFGFRYKLATYLDLELEMGFRRTFTDYLDDVSDEYVNPDDIPRLDPVAQILHDRIDFAEYPNGAQAINGSRGDPTSLDWYIYTCLRLNYILNLEGYRL